MTPKKIYVPEDSIKCLCHYDNSALALVINFEKTRSVEYTDLSQVWHEAKEEPEKGKLLIGIDEDGVSIYKWADQDNDWLSFAECNGLFKWAYIDDLLPKGGE